MLKKYKLVNFCEFDKYATQSYCAIHGVDESKNLGDITKVNEKEIEDFNMMVGGSPLAEWLRILREKNPNFAMYENVKNIIGKQFKPTFELFEKELNEYGYNTYYKVLNAKNYGVPQNRERVYLIIIKKELDNGKFKFPEGFDNGIRLKDVLEYEVDENFYISQEKVSRLVSNMNDKAALLFDSCQIKREGKAREYNDYAPTLTARDYKDPRIINDNVVKQVGNIVTTGNWNNPQRGRIYSINGCSPTLNCCGGGGLEPKILTHKVICLNSKDKEGKQPSQHDRIYDTNGVMTTICAELNGRLNIPDEDFKIRKLTPKECFRLMGFEDEDFNRCKIIDMSNSQLYKQTGNSIVVDVLFEVLLELYKAMPYLFDDIKLSSFFSGIGAFEKALDRLFNYIENEI